MKHLIALLALACAGPAFAESNTDGGGGPGAFLIAAARLDFRITINKYIYFKVGTGTYPAASATIDTVAFNLAIPAGPFVPPGTGNSVVAPWDTNAPLFTSPGNVLASEVRSNAGQVALHASVVSPLVSGANTILFSSVVVSSSDPGLPAPTIPNVGAGPTVNVTGTSFGNLVTDRNANWTFAFSPAIMPVPGLYNGQLMFTATSP